MIRLRQNIFAQYATMPFDALKVKKASFGFVATEVVNIPHLIVEESLVENTKP